MTIAEEMNEIDRVLSQASLHKVELEVIFSAIKAAKDDNLDPIEAIMAGFNEWVK